MNRYYTAGDVRQRLQQIVDHMGSKKAVADAAQVSPSFLSDVMKGHREPTGNILSFLRMGREVHYTTSDDRTATQLECTLAGVLLSRNEPLSPHHAQALRGYLDNMTDEELRYVLRTGKKYP